ncbi:MAG: hypothetical protein M1819_001257 [Sarea resinae]|nr:MAG: hypothetical protein M1819_001257 [Sarea resinae]
MAVTAAAEALVLQFEFERLLNQDQGGRRIILLGRIASQPAILLAERAAFSTLTPHLSSFTSGLSEITQLGSNDIYSWYLASSSPAPAVSNSNTSATDENSSPPPDLKLNLIYPCTPQHVKKYSSQGVRMVTETPEIYAKYVRPYMQRKRDEGRLNWVWNIIEGRTEQEDVFYRQHGEEGFLVLPDLNWDRKTLTSLHLLGLVERRDIWSLRDLRKSHVTWLRHMRSKLLDATVKLYPQLETDQLKLYVHCLPPNLRAFYNFQQKAQLIIADQPTYYHFHIHIVHVSLEAGATQATGKAFGLENLIAQLETIGRADDDGAGLADVSLTYFLGEANELWTEIFSPLKETEGAKEN